MLPGMARLSLLEGGDRGVGGVSERVFLFWRETRMTLGALPGISRGTLPALGVEGDLVGVEPSAEGYGECESVKAPQSRGQNRHRGTERPIDERNLTEGFGAQFHSPPRVYIAPKHII